MRERKLRSGNKILKRVVKAKKV